jgi:hypothetical protein
VTTTKVRRPCANCPWRVDAPRGYWDPQHFVAMPNKHPQKHKTLRDCEHQLLIQRPSHAQAQNGEIWTCTCSKRFEHICDEAEGCRWDLMP